MRSASKVLLVILTFIVIVHVCELLVVTEKFGCFSQEPTFDSIGPMSEMACRVSLLFRKGFFYEYRDGICYIDASGSDVANEGNCAGRFFETLDWNPTHIDKPTSSSPLNDSPSARSPANAVDDKLNNMFHSAPGRLENWWTLDLLRSYNISSIKVFYRKDYLERAFNIKIYVSTFLDPTDLFSSLPLFARQDTPPLTTEVTYTPESGEESVCGQYVVITKKATSDVTQIQWPLEFYEVQPMIKTEILQNLLASIENA